VKFEIYCDESYSDLFTSKKNDAKFMVIGGIWVEAQKRIEYKHSINQILKKNGFFGELKWNKILGAKIDLYKQIIDCFFENDIRYRCIVIEKEKVNLVKYHCSDAELGFYKFYYQLLHHWIDDFNEYSIFLDNKTNRVSQRQKFLKECLKKSNPSSGILNLQSLKSHQVLMIQIADLLTGAVAAKFNNNIRSQAKKDVVKYLEEKQGRKIAPTVRDEVKFNIFKIDLDGEGK